MSTLFCYLIKKKHIKTREVDSQGSNRNAHHPLAYSDGHNSSFFSIQFNSKVNFKVEIRFNSKIFFKVLIQFNSIQLEQK